MSDREAQSTVVDFEEKPELGALVSMGVYVLEPECLELIPKSTRFDVPELIRALLDRGARVGTSLHTGAWFDIGRHEDYEAAVQTWLASPHGAGTTKHDVVMGVSSPEPQANGAQPA